MNKKFFTLIAGLLMLAASLGTGHAQFSTGKSPTLTPETLVVGDLYQLGVTDRLGNPAFATQANNSDEVLAMVADNSPAGGGRYRLLAVPSTGAYLANTLWRLQISGNVEAARSYSFVNVATGQPLNFDPVAAQKQGGTVGGAYAAPSGNALFVGGSIGTWKWQSSINPVNEYFRGAVLTAAFAELDSALTLIAGGTASFSTLIGSSTVTINGTAIGAVKYSLGNIPATPPANPRTVISGEQVFLTPYQATPVLLTPDDLNSMLWSQRLTDDSRVSFTFDPTVQNSVLKPGNLFTEGSFKATWAVGYPADYAQWLPNHDAALGTKAQSTYQPALGAYTTAQKAAEEAEYAYKYLKAKREFGLKVAGILAKYTAGVDAPTLALRQTEIGNLLTDLGTEMPTLEAAVINKSSGSQDVAGTAANAIKSNTVIANLLKNGANIQKELLQAAIDFAEIKIVDPETSTLYAGLVTSGTYPTNDIAANVYQPLMTKIGGTWPDPITKTSLETWLSGVESPHPNYNGGLVPWTADNVNTLSTAYQTAYNNLQISTTREGAVKHEDARWVSLIVNNNYADERKWTYLSVDTAYLTDRTDLKFKVQPFVDVVAYYPNLLANDTARLDLNGRFNFQFLWYPTTDSLSIRVGGFAKKLDTQKNWGELNTAQNPDLGLDKAVVISSDVDQVTTDWYNNGGHIQDRNVVKLALLSPTHSEVTVGDSEHKAGATPRTTINTEITIAHSGPADDRATLASGLYFINLKTNDKGRENYNGAYKVVHITKSNEADLENTSVTSWVREDDNQLSGIIQNFAYMPATQWVVEQAVYGDDDKRLVSIYNREYPHIRIENVQLYKTGSIANGYAILFGGGAFAANDTLIIREVKAVKTSEKEIEAAYKDPYLGYYKEKSDDSYYKLEYLHGFQLGKYLKVLDSKTDSILFVDINGASVDFVLEPLAEENKADRAFGYSGILTKGATKKFEALKREAYRIRVKASNLLFADGKYVVSTNGGGSHNPALVSGTGEVSYVISQEPNEYFLLKENNRVKKEDGDAEGTAFFALEEAWAQASNGTGYFYWTSLSNLKEWVEGDDRFGIKDGSLVATQEKFGEQRVAAFALEPTDSYLYRRFDGGKYGPNKEAYGDKSNAPVWLKFFKYNNYGSDFLVENSPGNKITNGFRDDLRDTTISFLGVANKYQYPEIKDTLSYTFYVDTAYVRNKTVMPQYMLALRPDSVVEKKYTHITDGKWIDEDGNIYEEDPSTKEEFLLPGLVKGEYLFNATDSVLKGNTDYVGKFSYGAEGSIRFAFVTGVHFRDTFYVLPDEYRTLKAKEIARDTLKYLQNLPDYLKHNLGENTHYVPRWGKYEDPKSGSDVVALLRDEDGKIINNGKSMVFQFRLIDEKDRRFLIETTTARTYQSVNDNYNAVHNNGTYPYTWVDEIAPSTGQWMAIKTVLLPVVSAVNSFAQSTQNTAEIFDVFAGEKDSATSNEAVATETSVKVISENGAVTILNAAGKSVAISNILGQTVAASVLTSDNARIALPKGIVIVSVEGEAAIKAVVK